MSVFESIIGIAEKAIKKNTILRDDDITAMMRAGYDQNRDTVLPDCAYAMLFVRWRYYRQLDFGARQSLNKFCTAAIKDDMNHLLWVEQTFLSGANASAYAHVPPIAGSKRDTRLIGNWSYTSYLRSGGSSLVTYYNRSFSPDGRFVENRQSSFSSTFTDSFGNWAGWSNVYNNTTPGSRGRWATFSGRVAFLWDSNQIADYPYEAGPDYYLLLSQNNDNQLWKRR